MIQIDNQSKTTKIIWYIIAFSTVLIAVLRGIRFPNMYSYTHFLFNYEYGFVKRGLAGTIIRQIGAPYFMSYDFFLLFSMMLLIVNIILISLFIKKLIDSMDSILISTAIIFSSSVAIVYLSHLVGYFDHIGLLITLITLNIKGLYKRIILLMIAMPIVLLFHEANLILFFPVQFMALLFCLDQKKIGKQFLPILLYSVFILSLSFFITKSTIHEDDAMQMYSKLQYELNEYDLREDAFPVLSRDANDNLNAMKNVWAEDYMIIDLSGSLLVTVPTIIFIIYIMLRMLIGSESKSLLILILSILASLSPLVLLVIASDLERWNAIAITTSFLMLIIVYTSSKNIRQITMPQYIIPIIFFLVFLGGVSSISLLDDSYMNHFPFLGHQRYIYHVVTGEENFPVIPTQ